MLENGGAEAAREDVLLDRDDELVVGGETVDQAGVERLVAIFLRLTDC